MRTIVVIPTYNERENLRSLVERIAAAFAHPFHPLSLPLPRGRGENNVDILIVDDASPDGTGDLAEELAYTYPVHVLHRPKKEGLGAAYVAGFQRALADGADIVVQMDADGSHDPAEIPRMVTLLDAPFTPSRSPSSGEGEKTKNFPTPMAIGGGHGGVECTDLVIGSRRVTGGRTIGWGWHRRFMSASAQWFARHLLGLRTRDVTSGFRVWRAQALRGVLGEHPNDPNLIRMPRITAAYSEHSDPHSRHSNVPPAAGYAFQEEMLFRAEKNGTRIIEHPITFRDRERGCSKLGWRDIVGFFHACLRLRREGKLPAYAPPSRDAMGGHSEASADKPHPDGLVTWSHLTKSERRFALGVGVALVLLTGLPYLYGWLRTPTGFTYTGVHALSGGDAHVYYSYIEQARDGAFTFRDLFTDESNRPIMTQLPWFAVGLFARVFHLSAPFAFHLVRLLLIIPYIMFLAVVIATIARRPFAGWSTQRIRKVALLFMVFGGGIGGLFGAAFVMHAYDTSAYSAWPIDFWVPEAFTFLTVYQSAHFIISTWLLLAVYLSSIRMAITSRIRWTVTAAVAAAVLAQFHPFYIPLIVAIVVAHAGAQMLIARKWISSAAAHAFWTSLAMLPAFAYWWPIALLDSIHAARAAQNLLLMPPIGYVLAGYGFLLPLAIIGLVAIFRSERWRQSPAIVFLVTWAVVNGAMLWSPFAWQRRFTQGWFIALALLATVGVATIIAWLRHRLPARWFPIVCTHATATTLFVLLIAFTNVVNIGRDIAYYTMRFPTRDPKFMFYYPTAGIEAMRWLRAHAGSDDVTLAIGLSANFIPGWTARPVYIGHSIETARMNEKEYVVLALLNPQITPATQRAMLAEMRIHYLFVTSFEPPAMHLDRIARALNLPRVFENEAVAIYRVD